MLVVWMPFILIITFPQPLALHVCEAESILNKICFCGQFWFWSLLCCGCTVSRTQSTMWQWMLMYINSKEAAPGDYLLCQLHVSQKDMVLSFSLQCCRYVFRWLKQIFCVQLVTSSVLVVYVQRASGTNQRLAAAWMRTLLTLFLLALSLEC